MARGCHITYEIFNALSSVKTVQEFTGNLWGSFERKSWAWSLKRNLNGVEKKDWMIFYSF